MLSQPFNSYTAEKNWAKYMPLLCEKGIDWWFNLQILKLNDHIMPVNSLSGELPDRFLFLREATKPDPDLRNIETLYHKFVASNDIEAACAAVTAAWWCICEKGTDLGPADSWFDRSQALIDKQLILPPAARARLIGDKGLYNLLRFADLQSASDAFEEALILAEQPEFLWLKLYISFGYGYTCLLKGEFAKLDVIEFNCDPLCDVKADSLVPIVAYRNAISLYYIVLAKPHLCISILSETMEDQLFGRLPTFISILAYLTLMLAYVLRGRTNQVKELAGLVQKRIVSKCNNFFHAAIHCIFGIQELSNHNPHRALSHLQETSKRARMCNCRLIGSIHKLLKGEVLSDLNRVREAKRNLEACLLLQPEGHNLLAAQSALELSHLMLKQANRTEAKKLFNRAIMFLPQVQRIPIAQRGRRFTERLYYSLSPQAQTIIQWPSMADATVRIRAFGHLSIDFGTGVVDEYASRALVTLALLKALIVKGGIDVPIFQLTDMLWPEADADHAYRNFKVTLSRLRRIHSGREEIDWVHVKQKKVSLSQSICSVDAILFQTGLKNAITTETQRADEIISALDLYQDDFLAGDSNYFWIYRHQNELREAYINGVLALAELQLKSGVPNEAIACLDKAQKIDPVNEQIYALSMQAYMQMGFPSNALHVYKKAKKVLKFELGLEPGPTLVFLGRKINEL